MEYTDEKGRLRVKSSAASDERAFAELVRPCQGTLYAAAMAITKNHQDALDAVQDGILKGWQKFTTLRDDQYFSTWLTRIVIRSAIDITRRRKPTSALPEDVPYAGGGHDRRLDVRRAIEALEQKSRVVAMLYYFEDMAVKDIARALGIRQGTVKSRLFRAREVLKRTLEGYRDDK